MCSAVCKILWVFHCKGLNLELRSLGPGFPQAGSEEQEQGELSSRYLCPAVVTERVGSC